MQFIDERIGQLARDWADGNPTGNVEADLTGYQAAVFLDPAVKDAMVTIIQRAVDLAGPGDEQNAWAISAVAQIGASMAAGLAATAG
jgi:hypothetical protein